VLMMRKHKYLGNTPYIILIIMYHVIKYGASILLVLH
jgi:hypothetical protein